MTKKYPAHEQVWMRKGDLQKPLDLRAKQLGDAPAKVIRRDLNRYYHLLERGRERLPALSLPTIRLLVGMVTDRPIEDPANASLIWANLDTLGADAEDVAAVRAAGLAGQLVLVDAAEQAAQLAAAHALTPTQAKAAGFKVA